MTNETKVLVSPEDYKNLKEGEEIELCIRRKVLPYDRDHYFNNFNEAKLLKSIHKILLAATPLEVGEIIKSKINPNNHYEIMCITTNGFVTKSKFGMLTLVNRNDDFPSNYLYWAYRESDIPIDWEETFKS